MVFIGSSFRRQDLFSVRVPLSNILSIRQSFPSVGNPNIVIVVKERVSLCPFYFYEGGIREVIKIVQQLINLAPSESDPDLFTIVTSPFPFGFQLPPTPSQCTPDQRPYSPTHPNPSYFESNQSNSSLYPGVESNQSPSQGLQVENKNLNKISQELIASNRQMLGISLME